MNGYHFLVLALLTGSESAPIDEERALGYFKEARDLSEADGGRLWGVELYGPMLFVDKDSRVVVASHPDKQSRLTRRGDVFRGYLPVSFPVANTAVTWAFSAIGPRRTAWIPEMRSPCISKECWAIVTNHRRSACPNRTTFPRRWAIPFRSPQMVRFCCR